MGEVAVQLQQAKTTRIFILESVELQLLRVVQRTAHPFAVAQPHRQAVGVVDLRMDSVAHPPFVIAAAEHTGHRRDAQLFDVFTRVDVVFHIHNHLRLLTVHDELIGAGDAWAVEQRIDGKYRRPRFNGLKPERGEVRELFRRIGKGIDRQAAG